MIDPATGMKAGERYIVESLERTRHFPGFFLDGKYYLGPELMTAIGWLEGQQFYYDELDPRGEPVFPNRLAGTVENLTLILADGARLPLNEIPYEAEIDPSDISIPPPLSSGHRLNPGRLAERKFPRCCIPALRFLLLDDSRKTERLRPSAFEKLSVSNFEGRGENS
ncbi:hypothetical protein [Pseudomonas yamanorum]|uniref:hypothetical protein n=1 Tax=Pseudomonas yamanorum TaxID=515393 RepID=UPI003D35B386